MFPSAEDRFSTVEKPPLPGDTAVIAPPATKRGRENPYDAVRNDYEFVGRVRERLQPHVTDLTVFDSEFPEMLVKVPDEWDYVVLAPLYDAHIGSANHDAALFREHTKWLETTPNVLTWNGGDAIENANKLSPGSGVYHQTSPQNQIFAAVEAFADIRHKMLFSLSGNHEDRIEQLGVDVSQWIAQMLSVPYFPGYCMCRLLWRDLAFNIFAHHGSGAAQTAGAQLNNIRKELPWAHGFDLYWFGHLHRSIHSKEFRIMHDPRTHRIVRRECYAILSPSYLKYFGSYAEKKRMPPSTTGMVTVTLRPNGRIDLGEHAAGVRF